MQVREVLKQKIAQSVWSIAQDETVYAASKIMAQKKIGVLAVLSQSRLIGIVSERDILIKVVSEDLDPHRVTVGEIMTRDLITATADESFESCEEKMKRAHCRHILIVDSQSLIGILSLRDILDSSTLEKYQPVTVDEATIWMLPTKHE
jgi:CBS domain-containing protein